MDHPRKGLIDIQSNDDNECFKWYLVRYWHLAGCNQARSYNKNYRHSQDRRKKNSSSISVFGYESKEKYSICISKRFWEEKHIHLLLLGEERRRHYALIKNFNRFMYDHILHRGKKHFCRRCIVILLFFVIFVSFSTEEILKRHIKGCFKINDKQRIIIPEKQVGDHCHITRQCRGFCTQRLQYQS